MRATRHTVPQPEERTEVSSQRSNAFAFPIMIAVALSLGAIPDAAGKSAAKQPWSISHRARSLQPGEAVLLRLQSTRPVAALEAKAFNRTFPMYSEAGDTVWQGLVGIDLETRPGRYAVLLRGSDASGRTFEDSYTLAVRAKAFPTRRLTVDEKFVTPPKEVEARIKLESEKVGAIHAGITRERYWRGAFVKPVTGAPISSFGKRSILNGKPRSPHTGTDFASEAGDPIVALNAGVVVLAEDLYFSGNSVIIDHGQGLYSYYAHLSAIVAREGARIAKGELLGRVGATGRVTGPHLHLSVRLVGTRVDPMSLLSVLSRPTPKAGSGKPRRKTER